MRLRLNAYFRKAENVGDSETHLPDDEAGLRSALNEARREFGRGALLVTIRREEA